MKIVMSLMFICIIVVSSFASMTDNDVDTYLVKIFEYQKHGNIQKLESLKSEIEKLNNSSISKAYCLALYISDNKKYENKYVDIFPIDYKGIMYDMYEKIELKRLTPKFLYSFDAIGAIALSGNLKAMKKVLNGYINSDGVVSELFCDYIIKLIDNNLHDVLIVLAKLGSIERNKIYECFIVMTHDEISRLKKNVSGIETKNQKVIEVIQEICRLQVVE